VYKDECSFSFDTPFAPGGLYVSLSTHMAVGGDFLELARGARLRACVRACVRSLRVYVCVRVCVFLCVCEVV
jgi:hypothetical protein